MQSLDEWLSCPDRGKAPGNALISVPGATVTLGKTKSHSLYGWDNEFGTSESEVWDFKAGKHLVSNEEFLQFIEENGYTTEDYWTAEGW